MKIHNKLEITESGETKVIYNTMLPAVFDYLENFEAYNNYLVFNSGALIGEDGEQKDLSEANVFKSVVDSYNFNAQNGQIYITKQIDFGSVLHDEFTFCEVGISGDKGDNLKLVNRFVIKNESGEVESVTIKKKTDAVVKITTYIDLNSESTAKYFDVQSPFFAIILGVVLDENLEPRSVDDEMREESSNLSMRLAYFDKPTMGGSQLIQILESEVPITVEITKEIDNVNFKVTASITDMAIRGVVFCYGSVPCFFVNCFDLFGGEVVEFAGMPNSDGLVTISDDYIYEIVERVSVLSESSEITSPYDAEHFYGMDYGEPILNPFGDMDYSSSEKRYFNTEGNLVLFLMDGRVDMYHLNGAYFEKIDTEEVNPVNFLDARIVHDLLIVRYFNESTYNFEINFYLHKNLKMYKLSLLEDLTNTDWVDWDACGCQGVIRTNQPNIKELYALIYSYTGGTTIDRFQIDTDKLTIKPLSELRKIIEVEFVRVIAENEYGEYNACFYGIQKTDASSYSTYYINQNMDVELKTTANSVIKYITVSRTDSLDVVHAGAYTLAFDNSKAYQDAVRMYMVSVSYSRNANYSLGDTVERAYFSSDGRYVARLLNTGDLRFAYSEFDRATQYKFAGSDYTLPAGKTVKRVDIMGNVILITFNEEGSKMIELPILANKVYVDYLLPDYPARIKYKKANILGGSEKTVTVDTNVILSI